MSAPHENFNRAFVDVGWHILVSQSLHGSGNPRRLQVRRGKVVHSFLVYAWNITIEGKGRVKAGRTDLDYRIQTTRSHDSPLEVLPGHVTLGIGWDEGRGVFAAFDPWMKRYTGGSSSVHFHRALLDRAVKDEWAEEDRDDGLEVAFTPRHVDRYLAWTFRGERRPLFPITPQTFDLDGQMATIVLDDRKALALRPGDSVVIIDHGRVSDRSVWEVRQIESVELTTESGNYNRVALRILCNRVGAINDPLALEGGGM